MLRLTLLLFDQLTLLTSLVYSAVRYLTLSIPCFLRLLIYHYPLLNQLFFNRLVFFFYRSGNHRDLHVLTPSFPTRRSSDLLIGTAVYTGNAAIYLLAALAAFPALMVWQRRGAND